MLCFLTGTGTGIGKTHLAQALLRASPVPALGYKPVESGFAAECDETDAAALARASTFHVKHPGRRWLFPAPLSPHLAAGNTPLKLDDIEAAIRALLHAPALLVELPGGLFTPLTDDASNVHLIQRFPNARVALVAPDRLGTLHDILAASTAASALGVAITSVLLSTPAQPDQATGLHEPTLRRRTPCHVHTLPHAPVHELATLLPTAAAQLFTERP